MDAKNNPQRTRPGFWIMLGNIFPARARRQIFICMAGFILVDLGMLAICPLLGGDCLYGFFTLIVFPVILSGVLAVLLPRFTRRYHRHWGARLGVSVGGALMLGAIIVTAHAAAISLLNAQSYGGLLIRPRLLYVELILAMVYYAPLSIIVFVKSDNHDG